MGETHTWDTADSFAFADAAPSKDAAEAKPLKVLVIGNSFSVSLMAHFPVCAKSAGCPLTPRARGLTHCRNIS